MAVRWAAVLAVLACVLATGCTVREPDPRAWRELARLSLGDTVSETATVRMVLQQLREDRVFGSYAVTVAAESEEGMSTAEERLSSVQPPEGFSDVTGRLLDLIGRAADAVTAAREVIVAGQPVPDELLRRLARVGRLAERELGQV